MHLAGQIRTGGEVRLKKKNLMRFERKLGLKIPTVKMGPWIDVRDQLRPTFIRCQGG
jgi:hypothetical protein